MQPENEQKLKEFEDFVDDELDKLITDLPAIVKTHVENGIITTKAMYKEAYRNSLELYEKSLTQNEERSGKLPDSVKFLYEAAVKAALDQLNITLQGWRNQVTIYVSNIRSEIERAK
ncbi:MAG: hypothetical protein R3B41_01195 [Candidatus Doudnabacteria bacterium]